VTEFNFLSSKNDSSSDSNFNSDDDQNESIKDDNQADDLPF